VVEGLLADRSVRVLLAAHGMHTGKAPRKRAKR
jgi:hypothetical protein